MFLDNHFRAYGGISQSDADFARRYNSKVSNQLSMLSSGFSQQVIRLDNMFNSNEAIMRSQIIASKTEATLNINHIFEVNEHNYRNVNDTMKAYLISHPKIYRKVRNQTMDGYENSGFQITNDMKQARHREDYMQVIGSGIIDSKSVKQEKFITSRERTLSHSDRINIYKSWLNILDGLGDDIDMTDI